MPMTIVISAINQRLIEQGLRRRVSVIVESGQVCSSHHVATVLGFGASAVYSLGVQMRAEEKFGPDEPSITAAFKRFAKAAEKSLMKTMGRVGLCTVESYIGGEFFEPSYLDTNGPVLDKYFPNVISVVGGVGFRTLSDTSAEWHGRALEVGGEKDLPLLGLFKERAEGAGHSYGTTAVRGFIDMTEEAISFGDEARPKNPDMADPLFLRTLPLHQLEGAFGLDDEAYRNNSFDEMTPRAINSFDITPGYRSFVFAINAERARRPAALRDVLAFPADVNFVHHGRRIPFRDGPVRVLRQQLLPGARACRVVRVGDEFTLTAEPLAGAAACARGLAGAAVRRRDRRPRGDRRPAVADRPRQGAALPGPAAARAGLDPACRRCSRPTRSPPR